MHVALAAVAALAQDEIHARSVEIHDEFEFVGIHFVLPRLVAVFEFRGLLVGERFEIEE